MKRSILDIVFVMALLVGAGSIAYFRHQLATARDRVTALALAEENLRAERDSTREVSLENERVRELLGDSLRLFEKRVVQVEQKRDALDAATGSERRGTYTIDVAPAPLWGSFRASAVASPDTATRVAHFEVRQPPYSIAAKVSIPPAPDSSRLEVVVNADPIELAVRLSCSAPDSLGVRGASVSATAPSWATLKFGRVEQAPDVCQRPSKGLRRHFVLRPLSFGVGRATTWGGTSGWALFVGATVSWK